MDESVLHCYLSGLVGRLRFAPWSNHAHTRHEADRAQNRYLWSGPVCYSASRQRQEPGASADLHLAAVFLSEDDDHRGART
jgi:hypothetical protein